MRKIIALFGKSGAGKDTIQNYLLKKRRNMFHRIVSCTTRPPRERERRGVDYHFISEEVFMDGMMKEEFIEALEFNNWFYGAKVNALDSEKINIGIFTPEGIHALLDTAGCYDLEVLPIYIECNDKERLLRALNRETNPDIGEIIRRYSADEADFAEIDYDFATIRNDTDWMTEADFVEIIVGYAKDFFD